MQGIARMICLVCVWLPAWVCVTIKSISAPKVRLVVTGGRGKINIGSWAVSFHLDPISPHSKCNTCEFNTYVIEASHQSCLHNRNKVSSSAQAALLVQHRQTEKLLQTHSFQVQQCKLSQLQINSTGLLYVIPYFCTMKKVAKKLI